MARDLRYLDVAERVLARHGRPLRARDLINLGIEDGYVESWDSDTPQKSMQARLSIDILEKGEASRFIRTERGRFYLRYLLGFPLSKNQDLLSSTGETPNYARPFTARRRTYPSPLEYVLTVPRKHYERILDFQGLQSLPPEQLRKLVNTKSISYIPRIRAETLDDRKQVLTYVLVRHKNKVLSFRRGSYNNIAAFLRGSRCIGFGGHVTEHDHTLFSHDDLHGRTVHVTTSEADLRHDGETHVIKFHGDLNAPNEMVLSESHYEKRMRLESAMDLRLRSDILGRAILFVGYSFRDPNIAYLFRTVNERFGDLPHSFAGKRAYIVATNPSDFELQLFQERKIEVIPTVDLDRTRAVSELLNELSS